MNICITETGESSRLQSCCSVPGVLPNSSLTGCALNLGTVFNPGVRFYGLFRSLQTIYGRRYATNALGYQAYACYTDCVFRSINATSTDSTGALVVDTSVLSDVFTANVDSTWDTVVNNSISACATVANRVPYSVRSTNGTLCSTFPWNLMV
ncbi:hypothetical protein B566_EDAN015087, partial [Ephemera danica]